MRGTVNIVVADGFLCLVRMDQERKIDFSRRAFAISSLLYQVTSRLHSSFSLFASKAYWSMTLEVNHLRLNTTKAQNQSLQQPNLL